MNKKERKIKQNKVQKFNMKSNQTKIKHSKTSKS